MEWKPTQVCIVVMDLDKTIEYCSSVLGIGPFRRMEVSLSEAQCHGKPLELTLKLAFARMGEMQLELIQAEPGENIYWEFLQKHGEGLHHLGFHIKDLKYELAQFLKKGFEVVQSGNADGVSFAYLQAPLLGGIIIELIQRR